jgi:transposase InsO family protein
MATHLRTELVLEALNMATWQRRPKEVIHHSDQGTQYTSIAFGLRCKELGVRPSMGSVGDAYDNAMCERFFATLACGLLDRNRFTAQAEARMAVFDFIEGSPQGGRGSVNLSVHPSTKAGQLQSGTLSRSRNTESSGRRRSGCDAPRTCDALAVLLHSLSRNRGVVWSRRSA